MGVTAYNLQAIKKELQHLDSSQLNMLCLRLAKYKKENKELLAYLLFEADDEQHYITGVKQEVDKLFSALPTHSYHAAKTLRKTQRLINKHVKFMASKTAEIELLLHYGHSYLNQVDRRGSYKPLRQLLIRPLEKLAKLIDGLHEDLQYDYRADFENLVNEAAQSTSWINKHQFV